MKPLAFLTILTGSMTFAQTSPSLRARELFYTPPTQVQVTKPETKPEVKQVKPVKPETKAKQTSKKSDPISNNNVPDKGPDKGTPIGDPGIHTVQTTVPLGLRYAVLKRDAAGKYQEVDPDSGFRAGDRIRLQVDSNTFGYLYVVMQGSSGNWQLLFPTQEVAGGSNRVDKGQSMQIPSGERGQFVFDENAGTEKIFLVLTRQPEQNLDKLIYSMQGTANAESARVVAARAEVRDEVVERLRSEVRSRDLVFEKVDNTAGDKTEKAAYVVNKSTSQDARLVVDVALTHR